MKKTAPVAAPPLGSFSLKYDFAARDHKYVATWVLLYTLRRVELAAMRERGVVISLSLILLSPYQ
jgi:hypothetical protein